MKWTHEFLDQKRIETDPLADDFIKRLVEKRGEMAVHSIFQKLIENIELPIEDLTDDIQEFLQATVSLPHWLSNNDLKSSNLFFIDHGPKLLLLLYFKSLPLLYSDVKGAQVLMNTGRLMHDEKSQQVFTRRIAETGQFLLNVMANDNFLLNGSAINSIRKVRLMK